MSDKNISTYVCVCMYAHIYIYICACVCIQLLQLCLTLYDAIDCILPASSVCGIFQARILEWTAISSSKGVCVCVCVCLYIHTHISYLMCIYIYIHTHIKCIYLVYFIVSFINYYCCAVLSCSVMSDSL